MTRRCPSCNEEKPWCSGFARWDRLCHPCRAAAGPLRAAPNRPNGLTKREAEVYELRTEHLTQQRIARELGISLQSVRVNLSSIRRKGLEVPYEHDLKVGA